MTFDLQQDNVINLRHLISKNPGLRKFKISGLNENMHIILKNLDQLCDLIKSLEQPIILECKNDTLIITIIGGLDPHEV